MIFKMERCPDDCIYHQMDMCEGQSDQNRPDACREYEVVTSTWREPLIENGWPHPRHFNIDDMRLESRIWRVSGGITLEFAANLIGVSSGWISSFERGYGLPDRPYPSTIVAYLPYLGYTLGDARAIARTMYPEWFSHPTYWYFAHGFDVGLEHELIRAGCDENVRDKIMKQVHYSERVAFGKRRLERSLPRAGDCLLLQNEQTSISKATLALQCARCLDAKECPNNVVRARGIGVGEIIKDAYADTTCLFEKYVDKVSGEERGRIVTRRFHIVLDDNNGKGFDHKCLTLSDERKLVECAESELKNVGGLAVICR